MGGFMHYRRISFFVLVILMFSHIVSAQQTVSVDQITLKQHLIHRVAPLYPPMAKVALIQGTVSLSVFIDVTGKVKSMKVVSGPDKLQRAAMAAVKQWTFRPFKKDGRIIPVTGTISLVFNLEDYGSAPEKK
jgi:TonB family protein